MWSVRCYIFIKLLSEQCDSVFQCKRGFDFKLSVAFLKLLYIKIDFHDKPEAAENVFRQIDDIFSYEYDAIKNTPACVKIAKEELLSSRDEGFGVEQAAYISMHVRKVVLK